MHHSACQNAGKVLHQRAADRNQTEPTKKKAEGKGDYPLPIALPHNRSEKLGKLYWGLIRRAQIRLS